MESAVAFGRVLRRLRKKKGYTQEELGFEAELRRTFVSILELGQQQPSLTTILKLSRVLDIRAGKMMDLVENEIQEISRGGGR
jgi:transcriptional regulator with XRE-family HTH domain